MPVPIDEILKFHESRTKRHIAAVNYFAGLLGCHFPKHDYDKFIDPIRVGYAYYNYARYHDGCKISKQYQDAFTKSHDEHHSTQPHHLEHYKTVQEIPNNILIEMVCDWASANFEQTNISQENDFESVMGYFNECISSLNWTDSQREFIIKTIQQIEQTCDERGLYAIWDGLI